MKLKTLIILLIVSSIPFACKERPNEVLKNSDRLTVKKLSMSYFNELGNKSFDNEEQLISFTEGFFGEEINYLPKLRSSDWSNARSSSTPISEIYQQIPDGVVKNYLIDISNNRYSPDELERIQETVMDDEDLENPAAELLIISAQALIYGVENNPLDKGLSTQGRISCYELAECQDRCERNYNLNMKHASGLFVIALGGSVFLGPLGVIMTGFIGGGTLGLTFWYQINVRDNCLSDCAEDNHCE